MARIQWKDSFSVGIDYIDQQHKKLVEIINQLNDAIENESELINTEKVFNELVKYHKIHFRTEEDLFDKYDYPEKEDHKNEHRFFIEKIEEWKTVYSFNDKVGATGLLRFLKDWLLNHLMDVDKEYVPWMKSKGL